MKKILLLLLLIVSFIPAISQDNEATQLATAAAIQGIGNFTPTRVQTALNSIIKAKPNYLPFVAAGTDNYSFTTSITSYTNSWFVVKFANANTVTNPTINITAFGGSPLGAKSLVRDGAGTALAIGDITTNTYYNIYYDGTNFQISPLAGVTTTASNGITKTGNNFTLGGALTAATTISGSFDVAFNNRSFTAGSRGAGTIGNNSFVMGVGNVASSQYTFAIGAGNVASSNYAFATGNFTTASGNQAISTGLTTLASGQCSFVGGLGVSSGRPVTASGSASINFGTTTAAGFNGEGATAPNSIILGAEDGHVPSTSPRSVILGGQLIVARASDPDQVYVPNFNIVTTPSNDDALTQVLVRDASTGLIKYRNSSSILGGGSASFTGLTDSPGPYTGKGLNFIRVNAGESALEYQTVTQVKTILNINLVDNTSDANKPISTAQATANALNLKIASNLSDLASAPTARANLGIGNVDNTSDVNKPVSTAQAAANALNLKIASNLSDLANASTARANLGLGNVDNTSDVNKPVSTAQATAIAGKWSLSNGGLLTGVNTITSNTPNQFILDGSWAATANNQFHWQSNRTITSRSTASDAVTDNVFKTTYNINSTNVDANGLVLDVTYNMTGGIAAAGLVQAGTSSAGMTPGTYTNIALSTTSGTGTGALCTVVVATSTGFTSYTVTTAGTGYKLGDTWTINGSAFGGTGSSSGVVTAITSQTLNTKAAPLVIYNRIPTGGYYDRRFIDFRNASGTSVGGFAYNFQAGADNLYMYDASGVMLSSTGGVIATSRGLQVNGSSFFSNLSVSGTLSLSNAVTFSSGAIVTNSASLFNNSGVNGVFKVTGITGQNGNNASTAAFLSSTSTTVGFITTLGTITPGSGYTNGSYTNVVLTGGSGISATANITVSGGSVTVCTLGQRGTAYRTGDVLSASSLGPGSGFSIPVTLADNTGTANIGFHFNNTITDPSSSTNYIGFNGTPTINQTGSATGLLAALYWNPTLTSLVGPNYGIIIAPTAAKSGFGTTAPTSTMHVVGSLSLSKRTISASATLTATDHTIRCNAASGDITITLPTASTCDGRIYVIKKIDATANIVTFTADGGTVTLSTLNKAYTIQSNGTTYDIIGAY